MSFDFTHPLGLWAYFFLAVFVMVEGPLATLAGAVAASAGLMKPFWVFASAALGNLTADSLWYGLGYLGKTGWLVRYGRWFGLKPEQVSRLEKDIHLHAPKILFIAKLTLGFSIPTLIATGMARVPLRRWLGFLVLAETLWTGTLVVLGYHFGRYLQTLEKGVQIAALVGSLIFVGLLIAYLSRFRRHLEQDE